MENITKTVYTFTFVSNEIELKGLIRDFFQVLFGWIWLCGTLQSITTDGFKACNAASQIKVLTYETAFASALSNTPREFKADHCSIRCCSQNIGGGLHFSDWQQKGGFGLSFAWGGLAIAATSEITPDLNSQKEVGKFCLSSHPNSSSL